MEQNSTNNAPPVQRNIIKIPITHGEQKQQYQLLELPELGLRSSGDFSQFQQSRQVFKQIYKSQDVSRDLKKSLNDGFRSQYKSPDQISQMQEEL